jgi:catechol 2,3-dioxygenase-like lactoylglutathione lyase family enzyme
MTTKLEGGLAGVDHVAFPTWKPKETVHFYRDVLGWPLAHCILAPGWGKDPFPDFAHFFFDLGAGARIAFFYYFGLPPYEDPNLTDLLRFKARHLAMLVDTKEELDHYQHRLEAAGYELRHGGKPIMHELIESIYVFDPNGYNIEISRKLRPVTDEDMADTELSIQALCDVSEDPEPTLAKVWERKAELLMEQQPREELTRA